MKRRAFLQTLAGVGLSAALPALARSADKIPHIGYLVLSPLIDPPSPERAAFLDGLRTLGYEDGKNISIDYRAADGDPERLPFLAEDLVANRVDVIVVTGGVPATAARQATATIPIVMLFAPDPVSNGLVASLSRPGGNITGSSFVAPELGAKRLELLKEAIPTIRRVAVIWDSGNTMMKPEYDDIAAAARQLRIRIMSLDVKGTPLRIDKAFAIMAHDRPDAMIVPIDLRTAAYRDIIADFAVRQRLPTMFGLRDFAVAGGLLSYAPSFPELSRRGAYIVDKILRGAKPADLPVEQPTKFELVVNLKTAKALGIHLPQSILVRADEVIR